jgi:hypothetical protein
MKIKNFNPLLFLASLGAGGIAVMPFAFLQYTFHKGTGLVKYADINHSSLSAAMQVLFRSLEGIMIIFALLHIILSVHFGIKLVKWLKTKEYSILRQDPLKNSAIMAPFISLVMTMNVFIGPIRYFLTPMAENLQMLMLPALIFWGVIFIFLMRMVIVILKTNFINGFDVDNISFGWLLHPFALAMLTVTGTGIAAMAKDSTTAHVAAFMSFVSGSMGVFLLLVKMIMIFKSHFKKTGLPEKQFLPSFLIVIPNITLFAISAFRIGHYIEHQFSYDLGPYFLIVTTFAFAFETWYLFFGLTLLKDYFTKYYFKNEYYIAQWGLICPIVAYGVLGSFVFSTFIPNIILYIVIILTIIIAVWFYFDLLIRHMKCSIRSKDISCN